MRGRRARQDPPPDVQRGESDRHVDQEQRAPAGAERVELQQPAGDDRAEHGRQPDRRAHRRERLAHVLRGEQLADQAERLRHHHRGGQPLQRPGRDEGLAGRRERAPDRRDHEAGQAEQHHPAAAEQVAEPRAGHQADRQREGVRRRDPLQGRGAHRQVGADRRGGDVDDRRVEDVEDGRGEDDREADPRRAPRVAARVEAVRRLAVSGAVSAGVRVVVTGAPSSVTTGLMEGTLGAHQAGFVPDRHLVSDAWLTPRRDCCACSPCSRRRASGPGPSSPAASRSASARCATTSTGCAGWATRWTRRGGRPAATGSPPARRCRRCCSTTTRRWRSPSACVPRAAAGSRASRSRRCGR